MKTSSTISIIAAFLSAGGAMAGYIFLRPSNLEKYLEWQGLKLVTEKDDGLWKSIYDENKDSFSSAFSISAVSVDSEHWKTIRDYCTKAFKKTDYSSDISKSTKWCVDNVRTVRGQLVRKGSKVDDLMTQSEEYKTAAAVQGNNDFWELVGTNSDDIEEKAKAYQTWCETSLKSSPKNNLVQNVDNFCHKKPYSNFEDKLKDEGYRKINEDEIAKKYTEDVSKLRDNVGSNLLEEIGGGPASWAPSLGIKKNSWKIEEDKFKQKYKEYCESGHKMKLFEKGNYPDKYSKYRGICAIKEGDLKKR